MLGADGRTFCPWLQLYPIILFVVAKCPEVVFNGLILALHLVVGVSMECGGEWVIAPQMTAGWSGKLASELRGVVGDDIFRYIMFPDRVLERQI